MGCAYMQGPQNMLFFVNPACYHYYLLILAKDWMSETWSSGHESFHCLSKRIPELKICKYLGIFGFVKLCKLTGHVRNANFGLIEYADLSY